MKTVFMAIKSVFDSSPSLCPGIFKQLFLNEPPETDNPAGIWPFCVLLNPGNRVRKKRFNKGRNETWDFPCVFQVVHFTPDQAFECTRAIDSVFGVPGFTFAIPDDPPYRYQSPLVDWRNEGGVPQQIKEAVWVATTQYHIGYHRYWIGPPSPLMAPALAQRPTRR